MQYIKKRITALREKNKKLGIDSFFVTNGINVSYLSGFRGHDSMLFITRRGQFFITDSRYIEEAGKTVPNFTKMLVKVSLYETLRELISASGSERVGFESMDVPYGVAEKLKELLPKVKFISLRDSIEDIRSIKDEREISLIKKSVALSKRVLDKAIGLLRPGVTEKHLAGVIESEFIKAGAHAGFSPIVACNKNSSMPHARPGSTRISRNSFTMIDIGCNLDGYNSDITRTVSIGKRNRRFEKIFGIVQNAQEEAIRLIRPGKKISDIDNLARSIIIKEGYGKCFGHALGHGVGLDVHENPSVSRSNANLLRPGMVFTIEPAIYIPGFGGVRAEDMVLVTNDGHEILTR